VDGTVQGPVTTPIEAVPDGSAAAGRERAGSGKRRERGVVATPPGVGKTHDGLGGADWSDAVSTGEAWSEVIDDGLQLFAVLPQLSSCFAQGEHETTDLCMTDGVLAARVTGKSAPGERRQRGIGEGAASGLAVDVLAAEQQCPQSIGLRGAGGVDVLAGAKQDA
jgi:hypothetical protein